MATSKKKSGSKTKKTSSAGKKVRKSKTTKTKSKTGQKKLSGRVSSAPKMKRNAIKKQKVNEQTAARSEFIPQPPQLSTEIEADAAHMPGHRKLDRTQVGR